MRINQNISAMNTYSRLTGANNNKSASLAKLSSGLRINKAGDDAAGLAISEKMRGQVGGLKQAVRNAQDGISLIQTAEGALNETHSILGRMRDLAVQSSNDTNTDSDRAEIQKEMDQLSTEISRIANTTEFNTKNLLDGSLSDKKNALTFHIGANKGQNMDLTIGNMTKEGLEVEGNVYKAKGASISGIEVRSLDGEAIEIAYAPKASGANAAIETSATFSSGKITITLGQEAGKAAVGSGAATPGDIKTTNKDVLTALQSVAKESKMVFTTTDAFDKETKIIAVPGAGVTITANSWEKNEEHTGISVLSQGEADAAISIIDKATADVSEERSKLGSVQNRLEHTINNLTATSENLSAAESRIRDVDMAEEMMEFTKNNILSQAATSMLAQANQMPNSVLQLLQ